MNFAKRVLMAVGALALAAGLANFVAPKSVRAAVATLVQVANTTANPVATLNTAASASQNVALLCSGGVRCIALGPGGATVANPEPYTVPAGQNLVITDVEITPPGSQLATTFVIDTTFLANGSSCGPSSLPECHDEQWSYFDDGFTKEFQFPSGIVYPQGVQLFPNAFEGTKAYLRGYLTAN